MLNQDNIQNDIRKIIYDILDEQNEYLVMKANDRLYEFVDKDRRKISN